MDFSNLDIYSAVTLVDRAVAEEATPEFIYDGIRFVFRDPDTGARSFEKLVPQFVAEWMFRQQKEMVWTTDDQFVCRYAVKNAPKKLLDLIGPDAADQSPIEIDHERVEGSEVSTRDAHVRRTDFNPRQLRDRQGRREVMLTGPGR